MKKVIGDAKAIALLSGGSVESLREDGSMYVELQSVIVQRWKLATAGRLRVGIRGGSSMSYRVVCYINQFYGGRGGEEVADFRPELVEGPVGRA